MPTNFLNLPNWEVASVKESKNDYRVNATYGSDVDSLLKELDDESPIPTVGTGSEEEED